MPLVPFSGGLDSTNRIYVVSFVFTMTAVAYEADSAGKVTRFLGWRFAFACFYSSSACLQDNRYHREDEQQKNFCMYHTLFLQRAGSVRQAVYEDICATAFSSFLARRWYKITISKCSYNWASGFIYPIGLHKNAPKYSFKASTVPLPSTRPTTHPTCPSGLAMITPPFSASSPILA